MEDKPEQPLVSIIMAARNAEKYITEALQSLQRQSYPYWEAIVVNDASTDSTLQILRDFEDDRIYIINNDSQQGPHRSRNTAIASASGDYIAILDSDDIALRGRLEEQLAYFKENPDIDILGAGALAFGIERPTEILPPQEDNFIRPYLLFKNAFVHSSVMFRKSFFERSGLRYSTDYNVGEEDYQLFFEATATDCKMSNLPYPIVRYRLSGDQLSNSNTAKRTEALFRFFQARIQARLGLTIADEAGLLLFRFIMGRIVVDASAYVAIKRQLQALEEANRQKQAYAETYFRAVLYFFYIRLFKYYFLEKKKVLPFLFHMARLISKLSWESFLIFLRNRPKLKIGSTNTSLASRQG